MLMMRPRLLPERQFPAYAYLPGRQPHPVRDPGGHSYQAEPHVAPVELALTSENFYWGIDLFNYGYYWEAHEAWEGLWQVASSPRYRLFFKGMILLAATGVKIREGKQAAATRHATRAAKVLRLAAAGSDRDFALAVGMPLAALARRAEVTAATPRGDAAQVSGLAEPVFDFLLVPG